MNKLKCKRCGHEWVPRIDNPKVCGKCKSPYWNTERKNGLEKQDRRKIR